VPEVIGDLPRAQPGVVKMGRHRLRQVCVVAQLYGFSSIWVSTLRALGITA
jgi:hypothetical protein